MDAEERAENLARQAEEAEALSAIYGEDFAVEDGACAMYWWRTGAHPKSDPQRKDGAAKLDFLLRSGLIVFAAAIAGRLAG